MKRYLVGLFMMIAIAVLLPCEASAQSSIYCQARSTNGPEINYLSPVFQTVPSDKQQIESAWKAYVQSHYPPTFLWRCFLVADDPDGSKNQANLDYFTNALKEQRRATVMTSFQISMPQSVHSVEGEASLEAEALQVARVNAVRGFGNSVKEWQTPTCSQGSGKAGLYNEKTVAKFTCTVPFVTSEDKSIPFARSTYGEGPSQAGAIQAARALANRDHKFVKAFGEPLCSRNTKKAGLYNEKTIANWYCTIGFTRACFINRFGLKLETSA